MRISDWSSDVCSSDLFGAAFDDPDIVVACVIGDGEAETGPLAAAWHSNKFLDPVGDGAVLPILHLNGYKIANPTILDRIGDDELSAMFRGYGWEPYLAAGADPTEVRQQLPATPDVTLRSEESPEGQECVSTCRSRGSQYK